MTKKRGLVLMCLTQIPEGSWETYYRYWSIEDSEIPSGVTIAGIIYGYEPKNRTSEIGLRYRF